MLNDRRDAPPLRSEAVTGSLVEARFVPQRYEPNYAYPLLVLLHARGGDEQQMVRSMPAMSWRNYVGLSLRGPEQVTRHGQSRSATAGGSRLRPAASVPRILPALPDAEVFRRPTFLADEPDPVDVLEDGIFNAVRQTRRTLHVHSERIFLVGVGEGAAVAYRSSDVEPGVGLPGSSPSTAGSPAASAPWPGSRTNRGLRVLVVHGEWNGRVPVEQARRTVRNPPERRPEGRLPVLPVCPPADLAHARRRGHLADQPVHAGDVRGVRQTRLVQGYELGAPFLVSPDAIALPVWTSS